MTLLETAEALASAFEERKRDNGAPFLTLADGSPAWMLEAVHAVHGDRLPNDFDYRAASSIAGSIVEMVREEPGADLETDAGDRIDGLVPVYNTERAQWLADHVGRSEYVEQAREEHCLAADTDIFERIGAGMSVFYSEAWNEVARAVMAAAGQEG